MARIAPLLAFICLWLIGAQPACSGGLTLDPFWSTYDSKDALVNEKAPLLEQGGVYRPFDDEELRHIKKLHKLVRIFERNPVLGNSDRLTAYIGKPRIKSIDSEGGKLRRISSTFQIKICRPDAEICKPHIPSGAINMVTIDWGYFSSAASRDDIQLITVYPWGKKGFHNKARREIVAAADWDALFRLVE